MTILSPTAIEILRELHAGKLRWGSAVGACWPELARHGLVFPRFGGITQKGSDFVASLNSGESDQS